MVVMGWVRLEVCVVNGLALALARAL